MNRYPEILAGFLIFSLIITACSPNEQPPLPGALPWSRADLRLMDAPDAPDPSLDLIAGYARISSDQIEVRLDLLDIAANANYDLFLAVDNAPGGKQSLPGGTQADIAWDRLIHIPALGQTVVLDTNNQPTRNSNILTMRNPIQDFITISMPADGLPRSQAGLRFQAFSAPAGSADLTDSTAPFSLEGQAPAPAKTLLVFWNTLPAYSPAQALRRWDGAHTGPLGGRHGLGNLLKAARDYRAPVVLLDLKSISSVAALDFLDQVETLHRMADIGLVILPDVTLATSLGPIEDLPASILQRAAATSRQISLDMGLPASQFLYGSLSGDPGDRYRFQFVPVNQAMQTETTEISATPYLLSGQIILPISEAMTSTQITLDGPAIGIRRALVEAALQNAEGDSPAISILGGDLTRSAWGDPQHAAAALHYLTQHPWIKLLNAHDLLTERPAQSLPPASMLINSTFKGLSGDLEIAFDESSGMPSTLAENAWQAFLSLYAPASPRPPELPALRRIYLGQVNVLVQAARWALDPQPVYRCDADPDLDGQPECILASPSQFAVFERDSGALTYAFALLEGEAHQWIAPSSQFITGLSDPALWEMGKGLSADPGVIPGAFFDSETFLVSIQPGEVTFTSSELTKTFTLLENGMAIQYISNGPQQQRIPLGIDPWNRFQPDWEETYSVDHEQGSLIWGIIEEFQVELTSDASLSLLEFIASRKTVGVPENPNLDYPEGHFEIFPLAVVNITASGGFEVNIRFVPALGSGE